MTPSSSPSTWQRIRGELALTHRAPLSRVFIYAACIAGLVVPTMMLEKRATNRCVLSEQLLVSDPLTKGKSELSSGLELLGLAGKTDDPTLKAVLESQSVSFAMTQMLRERHPDDPEVKALTDKINNYKQSNRDNSPLQIKQKRGDRFQDLSIITISVRGAPDLLRRIQPDIREFYRNYGLGYRAQRTSKASEFANSQISRLRLTFEATDRELQNMRMSLSGFDPDSVLTLAKDNYARLQAALTQSKIDNSEAFARSTPGGGMLSDIVAKNNLQPVITSIPFKRLVTAYNSVKSRYLLLKQTRQAKDQELRALQDRIAELDSQIQSQLQGAPIKASDIPSTPSSYDAFEREVVNKSKIASLQKQSVAEKDYFSKLAVQAQSMQARYAYLLEEQKTTISLLATYRQLKEKLLLDSAKELSAWSIIDSTLQCQALPLRLLAIGLAIIYVFIIVLMLSPTLRQLGRDRTRSLISVVHDY